MKENSNKVLSFPSRVPAKADYQRVKSNYSIREIKELFGLSERTIRRWTEQGIIQGTPTPNPNEFSYDFQALTQFRRVRELRAQGQSFRGS
jgi:phage terminase Nu1 subunit (DNA packaging protein)